MPRDPKQRAIDVNELQYYFDAVERDSLDKLSHARRASEVLAIRDKLLVMPDRDFAAAVQTIKNILNPNQSAPAREDETKNKRRDAAELYDNVQLEKSGNPLKVNPL